MNVDLLNLLNEKCNQTKEYTKQTGRANIELEDSMLDDFIKLFKLEFPVDVEEGSYRAHGWYYCNFSLNNINGNFCYHPLTNKADIYYWQYKYIAGDNSGIDIEKLFNKFHNILDKS